MFAGGALVLFGRLLLGCFGGRLSLAVGGLGVVAGGFPVLSDR